MSEAAIVAACRSFGAVAVYQAAFDGLCGRLAGLAAMGLPARGVRDAHEALRVSFELLSPEEEAAALADATIGLAKLPPAPGAAPGDTEPEEGAN